MPCVTAFSTSGCSSSGGTRQVVGARRPRCRPAGDRRSAPARPRETVRASASSLDSGIRSRAPSASVSRRKSASSRHIRRAAGRIRRGQRADRLQAVEEEVRIDLRAQRPQLRFARQHLQLEPAPLGVARRLRTRRRGSSPPSPGDRAGSRTPKTVGAADAERRWRRRPIAAERRDQRRASRARSAARRRSTGTAATTAVAPTRSGPTRSTGEPPVTYHADRQRNP